MGHPVWEVSAWEISHWESFYLGNCHLESYPWEMAFVKVPLTLHILLDRHIVHIDTDCFENLHQFSRRLWPLILAQLTHFYSFVALDILEL